MNTSVTSSFLIASIALAFAGCASPESQAARAADTGAAIQQAAQTPLADLNLVQDKIPAVLQEAAKAPYAPPQKRSCADIAIEVGALDAALGSDLDTPPTLTNPGLLERGTGALGDAANGAIRGAGESVIPFRGWVRKLDGAERHSKDVAAAIAAGSVRRAYLKGVGQTLGCPAPAAPLLAAVASSAVTR